MYICIYIDVYIYICMYIGGIMVVTVAAVGRELLYEADPTSSEVYKTVGSKLMGEKETIDLVMAEGWPEELLDLCNRGNLAKKVMGNLKIIEDKSSYRLVLFYSIIV
jgi:hypothetical protein